MTILSTQPVKAAKRSMRAMRFCTGEPVMSMTSAGTRSKTRRLRTAATFERCCGNAGSGDPWVDLTGRERSCVSSACSGRLVSEYHYAIAFGIVVDYGTLDATQFWKPGCFA